MYHENTRKIIGQRTRREFSIGDTVTVLLDRVDPIERKLQFSLVEPERPRRKAPIAVEVTPLCSAAIGSIRTARRAGM